MDVADVDEGRRPGVTADEKAELVRLRRANRVLELENEILKRAAAYRQGERPPVIMLVGLVGLG